MLLVLLPSFCDKTNLLLILITHSKWLNLRPVSKPDKTEKWVFLFLEAGAQAEGWTWN